MFFFWGRWSCHFSGLSWWKLTCFDHCWMLMEENKANYSSAIYVSRGRMGRVGKISQSYGREKGTINHNRHHAEFAWDFWLQDGGLPTTTPLPSVAPCVCGPHTPGSRFRIKKTKKPSLHEEEKSPSVKYFLECKKIGHSGKLIFPECRTRGRESFSSTTDTRGRETLREVVSTQDPVGYCCADIC